MFFKAVQSQFSLKHNLVNVNILWNRILENKSNILMHPIKDATNYLCSSFYLIFSLNFMSCVKVV